MQAMFLQVLQQGPAGAMDDALGHAGGAGGIHDEERMIERQPDKCDLPRGAMRTEKILEQHGLGGLGKIGCRRQVRNDDNAHQAADSRRHRGYLLQAVDALAVVVVAVGGDEQLRLDLTETIEHALHAEVRRSRGEDRTDAGGGQHRHYGLGQIGQVGGDPVATLDAEIFQRRSELRHLAVQVVVGEPPCDLVLAAKDDGVRGAAVPQEILGIVETRLRKPAGARHPVAIFDHRGAAFADHPGVVPERAPELLGLRDRPAMESGVIGKRQAPLRPGLAHE